MSSNRSREISRRARFLARQLRVTYPVDEEAVGLAALLRKSRFDPMLEGKCNLSKSEYNKAIACFERSAEYAARLLRESLGEEKAEKVKMIIDQHLEHYDGSGPRGLKNIDILPEAYILNLSVAIQNMLDRSPNHGIQASGSVLENLVFLAGSQYPPPMVCKSFQSLAMLLDTEEDGEVLRMAELGRASAGVFHDMNQYLTVLSAQFSFIEQLAGNRIAVRELCAEGAKMVESAAFYRNEMVAFAKGDIQKTRCSINDTMDDALRLISRKLRQVRVVKAYGEVPEFEHFRIGLKHVFVNLLANAIEAMRLCGEIRIETRSDGRKVRISITDDGEGMGADQVEGIFTGRTTKEEGSGIGTRYCRYIVEKHEGSITYESALGQGTTVHIDLPIYTGN